MVPLIFSHLHLHHHHPLLFFPLQPSRFNPPHLRHHHHHHHQNRRFYFPCVGVRSSLSSESQSSSASPAAGPPRTLFPGGYKRAEIRVPSVVLSLDADDVLDGAEVLGAVDRAVARWVGAVVLNGEGASAGRIYEAACKLKSVVRDRAYLLVADRVDIASAANASGVVLSDQGLPVIVARSTMTDSKSESVVLPLVARKVESPDDALNASSSEGADFLIYSIEKETHADVILNVVRESVKIPIFVMITSYGEDMIVTEASKLLKSGASGLVTSLKGFEKFGDERLSSLFNESYMPSKRTQDELDNFYEGKLLNADNVLGAGETIAGFVKVEDREKQFIQRERSVLLEAINVIKKAAPLMEEVSLLADAVAQIDEPFLLAIVGEFNSGKSSVINALLGSKYLKEGVVPTTNEITFLRYSNLDSGDAQRCERHPDGQLICYLPAPILKEMNIVDTPGTNVILQRQQRLTEEFVPRADLLLFVISSDRPLTESEVSFLRYIQQWKKKVVFILNKSDLYQNSHELEEAISFITDNTRRLLNTEHVTIYPVSARTALEAKLSASKEYRELAPSDDTHWNSNSFDEFEMFLYSFLDGSTSAGMERMKLKLETPVSIAERILSSCETLVRQDCRRAKQDLVAINDIISSVKDYAAKMESESISWRRKALSSIDNAKSQALDLIRATLQLSNLDLALTYVFKGENSTALAATSKVQNDVIGPAVMDVQNILREYVEWLQSNNAREGKLYKESFEKSWPSFVYPSSQLHLETLESLKKVDELSMEVIRDFSDTAASKSFEQEIREVFLGTFGGLGAAGLSASLLTSVLPTPLEDLLALSLCSAGGFIAISNFPARRQAMVEKVKKSADVLARDLEDAMQKDLSDALDSMERFVKVIGEPYRDAAQRKLEKLLGIQAEILNMEKELQKLQVEIQNLHVS